MANGKLRGEVDHFRASRWFRLGQALRSARRPRGFVALPIRIARAVRKSESRPERLVIQKIATHLGLPAEKITPPSPLALFVTGTPPLSTWEGAESNHHNREGEKLLLEGTRTFREFYFGVMRFAASQLIDWGHSVSAVSTV